MDPRHPGGDREPHTRTPTGSVVDVLTRRRTQPEARRSAADGPVGTGFRGDVEGLRAVAVGSVLAYHAGVMTFSGGYVGVDIFFVISGYLITGLLLRELDAHGTVSLKRFYIRRIKRLLPLTLVVLATVVPLSWLLLSPMERKSVFEDVIAAALYAVNWQHAAQAVDYSELGTKASPVQHFWSLAVEEQFYLVWPLLLLAIAWCCRPRRGRAGRSARAAQGPGGGLNVRMVLAAVLVVLCLVSFVHAVQLTREEAGVAYFSTFTRAWELGIGGLLALLPLHRWRLHRHVVTLLGCAGLAMIAASVLVFTEGTTFPGPWAAVPVLGTAAVIAAGAVRTDTPVGWVLTLPPVRYVGRISYSWYLWHWPAVVFATAWARGLPTELLVLAVLLSGVPAALTHRLVEEPFRRSRFFSPTRPALALGAACMVIPVALSACSWKATPDTPLAAPADARGAETLQYSTAIQQKASAIRPLPEKARQDRGGAHDDGCMLEAEQTESGKCVYGDPSSDTTVVLFGDSHAAQYFEALDVVANQRDWRLVVLTKSACTPGQVTVWSNQLKREYTECDTWRDRALERIENAGPALVLTGNSTSATAMGEGVRLSGSQSTDALREGYADTLRRLQDTGAKVVVTAENPHPPSDTPACVSKSMDRLAECSFDREESLSFTPVNKQAARAVDGVRWIDPLPMLCPTKSCPAVIGNVLVYRNGSHITGTYMSTMLDWLDDRLPTTL